jgi:hypothetical protein
MANRSTFRTDEGVIQSGMYRVRHQNHRLPHEVTLLRGQRFPRCAKCQDAVTFELVVTFTEANVGQYERIRLYELPVLDDEQDIAI